MEDFPFWILLGVVALLVAAGIVIGTKRQLDAINRAWQTAAETLGFSLVPGTWRGGPTMTGLLDGAPAEIHSYTKSTGKSSTRYTRYTVSFPSIGIGLRLQRQSGMGMFLKVLGTQDIVIGEPVFDEAFIVQASDPQAARAVLGAGTTMVLNRLIALHPEIVVFDDRIVLDRRATVRDADTLISTLRRLGSAAGALVDAGQSEALNKLVEQRLSGALPNDYEPDPERTQSIDERLAIGETLQASGTLDIAGRIFQALGAELPADVEIAGWSKQTRRAAEPIPDISPPDHRTSPSVPDPPEPIVSARSEAPPPPAPEPLARSDDQPGDGRDRNAVAVATDLFGESRLSFETAQRYSDLYAERDVHWTGKIREVEVVEADRILGDGPFTKAVVDVAALENDLFGSTVVSAVVGFPESGDRRLAEGNEIEFTGTLAGIDALVRTLYVTNGRLA